MSSHDYIITRRDFMKETAVYTLGGMAGFSFSTTDTDTKTTKVVLIRNENVIDNSNNINGDILHAMVDQALMELFMTSTPEQAWKSLFKPSDIVGIKSNVWRYLSTPPELETTIKNGVLSAGVSENNIAVDDRGVLQNDIFQRATGLINVRPLRTHHWAGIGGVIKNHIMFVPDPYNYHADSCADLAKVWQVPPVKDKTRLNILSAIEILFHGRGPHHYDSRYRFSYKGIIVGIDPVAVDTVGLQIIKAKRKQYFHEERNLATPPHHIMYADKRHKLGISDLKRIQIIKKGDIGKMLI